MLIQNEFVEGGVELRCGRSGVVTVSVELVVERDDVGGVEHELYKRKDSGGEAPAIVGD